MAVTNNYTLGRGKIYFAPFKPNTQTPRGERYLGNTPEFSMNITSQNLDHYGSDEGIREKDLIIPLEVTRAGSLTTDNVDPRNLALFFFGSYTGLAITGSTVTAEAITDIDIGEFYQLGMTNANPSGARGLDIHTAGPPAKNVVVMKGAAELVEGTDYAVDMELARIEVLGGALTKGDNITVSYKIKTQTRDRVVSGSTAIEGALRYVAKNPAGKNVDYYFPWVKITPNGDFQLKAEQAVQAIPLNIEALKLTGREAIYADGRPAFA